MGRRVSRGSATFSERRFHAWAAAFLPAGRRGALPVGDDAAAVRVPTGTVAVLTTDAFVEGVHFYRESPARSVGEAVAAASLSDLASKGATPVALLIDLLIPPRTPVRWARAVTLGAEAMMARFGGHLVGGDTKPSREPIVVGTALGVADARRLSPRSGARAGDVLVVTGVVGRGGAAAGSVRSGGSPSEAAMREMLDIRPRVREGACLARHAHAMLDTSDGLAESAWLLALASGVKAVLDARAIPLVGHGRRKTTPTPGDWQAAFYGGDYELLAAIPPGRVAGLTRELRRMGTPLTSVGHVARGRGAVLEGDGSPRPLPRAGWDPFVEAAVRFRR